LISKSAFTSSGRNFHIEIATFAACKSFHFLRYSSIHSIIIFPHKKSSHIEILLNKDVINQPPELFSNSEASHSFSISPFDFQRLESGL
jgi:hypothetical protein